MTVISKLSLSEKQNVLARCLDLHGLCFEDRARLAPRFEELIVEHGEPICQEELEEEGVWVDGSGESYGGSGLYCIVEGLVSVTHRSEHRRAPVIFTLGPGGLFGESTLVGGGLLGAEAYRRSQLLRLDPAGIEWAQKQLPSFHEVVKRLRRIYRHMPWLADRLRRSALLRNVPPRFVYELLEGADITELAPGETLLRAGEDPRGIYVVMSGELYMCDRNTMHTLRILSPGDVFGDLELMAARGIEYGIKAAPERCRVLKVEAERVYELIGQSSTFRRFVLSCSDDQLEQRQSLISYVQDREQGAMNIISVLGDHPSLPISTLVDWVAEATATEFGDKVVVIHLDKRAGELPVLRGKPYGQGGEVVRVQIHPNSPLLENGTIEGYGIAAQYVFLDTTGGVDPGQLPGPLNNVDTTVYVANRPYVDPPYQLINRLPHPLLYTAVVPSLPLPPGQDPIVPIGTVRIHRDLIEAARKGGSFSELTPRLRRQVRRWGRALTDRRVGLALGGGGAFGFAHIPLIECIEKAGIPIDLISGCSVGAGVGAYYAARGLDGLSEFLAEAGGVLFKRGLISSRMIGQFIDGVLGGVRLEDLEIPFYPVVVDIDTACQTTIRSGTVGRGVQASASFPGFFTPTILEQRLMGQKRRRFRFVDGGVINIVPDDTLYTQGAQVALASNVIPPPRSRQRTSGEWVKRVQGALNRVPGQLGSLLRELDPIVRLDDCMRTMYIMMHAPVDWESRTADAKFRAIPGNYSPMQWHNGAEIARAQVEGDHLERVVARLQASYRALRWRQHYSRSSSDTEFELEPVNIDMDMSAEG